MSKIQLLKNEISNLYGTLHFHFSAKRMQRFDHAGQTSVNTKSNDTDITVVAHPFIINEITLKIQKSIGVKSSFLTYIAR
jgi:hypothetical protein